MRETHANAVYLSAPVNGLVEGIYRARTTMAELREHGDFGLGTFNRLDGEMVILDGEIFRMDAQGRANRVDDGEQTPFACVTRYRPDTLDEFSDPPGLDLFSLVARILPSPNMLYAVRVDGRFRNVRARSVPPQDADRPLVEVARDQPEFDYVDLDGTMVGFHTPAFLGGVAVPGLHLHFLSADHSRGGHVLHCDPGPVTVGIQHVPQLIMGLPMTLDFLTSRFERNATGDIDEAEG
jgi:acetolactate decarboxylase